MADSNVLQEPQTTRPLSQTRPSLGTTPSLNVPSRHSTSRNHSHSVSLGTFNPTHRVTRRKSMTSNAANLSTVVAVIKGIDETSFGTFVSSEGRGPLARYSSGGQDASLRNEMQLPSNSHNPNPPMGHRDTRPSQFHDDSAEGESAIAEGHASQEHTRSTVKARIRRASEGAYLTKTDGKRVSSGELRCEKCGKGYKHSSCLTKHLLVFLILACPAYFFSIIGSCWSYYFTSFY